MFNAAAWGHFPQQCKESRLRTAAEPCPGEGDLCNSYGVVFEVLLASSKNRGLARVPPTSVPASPVRVALYPAAAPHTSVALAPDDTEMALSSCLLLALA